MVKRAQASGTVYVNDSSDASTAKLTKQKGHSLDKKRWESSVQRAKVAINRHMK